MSAPVAGERAPAQWFGQPRGLTILFLTEMWMQFSFFGMRTILVYYMIKELMIPQGQSSLIYGGYAAAVYFTPIFGGYISDRWLGKAIMKWPAAISRPPITTALRLPMKRSAMTPPKIGVK